jgi:hypothetical protein
MATLKQLCEETKDPRLQAFIGKKAIVGIYQFYQDEPVTRSQDYGEIVAIGEGHLSLQKKDGLTYSPIRYDAIVIAPRGRYVLDSTGEEIIDPDLLISWRLDLDDELEESQWQPNTAPHFWSLVGKEWDFEYEYDRDFIEQLLKFKAESYVGKTIIIGVSEYESRKDGGKKLIKQSQLFGEIARLNPTEGVVIRLKDGLEKKLPPDISMLQAAPPGEYTLHSTGEVIKNPDLMTIWATTRILPDVDMKTG